MSRVLIARLTLSWFAVFLAVGCSSPSRIGFAEDVAQLWRQQNGGESVCLTDALESLSVDELDFFARSFRNEAIWGEIFNIEMGDALDLLEDCSTANEAESG